MINLLFSQNKQVLNVIFPWFLHFLIITGKFCDNGNARSICCFLICDNVSWQFFSAPNLLKAAKRIFTPLAINNTGHKIYMAKAVV